MLYFDEKLNHSLLCPNQMRAKGLTVHDTLTQFDSISTHSITVHRCDSDVVIPLEMKGVASIFESRIPTPAELDTCELLLMTSEQDRVLILQSSKRMNLQLFMQDSSALLYLSTTSAGCNWFVSVDCLNVLSPKIFLSFSPGWMAQIPGTSSMLKLGPGI